ncbi:hypothetical protein ABL78_6479 [Leptomonas seymouri]|uniref:Ama1 protein n=1 Tax=Leptomonas seymouri TaxID=5684 RepID=A0A0N1I201_LEPSE|nr:hypothetical protein ABL78_6479 [Leptomonas seymouri]|eukprot:KPI84473.1 hypothetical protein ABL78_6479 [Leptomonas seymouri]
MGRNGEDSTGEGLKGAEEADSVRVPPPHLSRPPLESDKDAQWSKSPARVRDARLQGDADGAVAVMAVATATAAPRRGGSPHFSSGLLECHTNIGVCLEACCCAYCMAGAHHIFFKNGKVNVSCAMCLCLLCVDVASRFFTRWVCSLCVPCALCLHTCRMRRALRQRYHLEGRELTCVASDFFSVCCCLPCALAQHQREIMYRGEQCGGVLRTYSVLNAPATVEAR